MRIPLTLISLLIIVLSTVTIQAEQEKKLRLVGVKKLVQEYLSEECKRDRRLEIKEQLQRADSTYIGKALRLFLKNNQEWEGALELAIDLKAESLWSTLKKNIDGDYEDLIIEYGFETQDKGALNSLIKRWKELEVGTPSFEMLDKNFRGYSLSLDLLEKFYDHLKEDNPKQNYAFEILIQHMELEDEINSPEELREHWSDFSHKIKVYGKKFSLEGEELSKWSSDNVKKVRNNYWLQTGGLLKFEELPESIQKGNSLLRLRVYPIKGEEASIQLSLERRAWEIKFDGREWSIEEAFGSSFVLPGVYEEWSTITFTITDNSDENMRMDRIMAIKINGEDIIERGSLNGEIKSLSVKTDGDSEMVIAGIEFIKNS